MSVSPKDRNNIKTGVWEHSGVFLYSTNFHLRYQLINGDSGVICNLDTPSYLLGIEGTSVSMINRAGDIVNIEINPTEYQFKLALQNRRFNEVSRILEGGNLCGNSVVSYL
jgi:coatomer protein complex subunit alpha (xenin)